MSENNGKYAFVTGGSRGIGRAISLKLAGEGYNIIINYKSNDAAANELLNELNSNGGNHFLLKYDVGNQQDTETTLNNWLNQNTDKEIHILVNNSGIRKDNLMIFMPTEDWNEVINTNLNSFFHTTKIISAAMIRRRRGRIINVVSLSGLKGMPGQQIILRQKQV